MADYPNINAAGIVTQLGWTEVDEHVVAEITLPCGISVTKAQHQGPKKRFVVKYPLIQLEEVQVVQDFFDSMKGRLGEFNFVYKKDQVTKGVAQDTVTWAQTRFDTDELQVSAVGPRHYEMEVKLISNAGSST